MSATWPPARSAAQAAASSAQRGRGEQREGREEEVRAGPRAPSAEALGEGTEQVAQPAGVGNLAVRA